MNSVEMIPVTSSNIRRVGYDAENKELHIEFYTNAAIYKYLNVEAEEFNNLLAAESVGRYFHQNIKGKYEFAKGE